MKNFLALLLLSSLSISMITCNKSSEENDLSFINDSIETSSRAATPPAACVAPAKVELTNAVYNAKENYTLTYTWPAVSGASKYVFKFYLDGIVAYTNSNVIGNSITFTQVIPARDKMQAKVSTICNGGSSSSSQGSLEVNYFNSIGETDIVMRVSPGTSVNDICAKNCLRLKFTGSSILNTDGTIINLTSPSSKLLFLDHAQVKSCINCNGSAAKKKVNPSAFNDCLVSPGNNYYIYDPNAYRVCP